MDKCSGKIVNQKERCSMGRSVNPVKYAESATRAE